MENRTLTDYLSHCTARTAGDRASAAWARILVTPCDRSQPVWAVGSVVGPVQQCCQLMG